MPRFSPLGALGALLFLAPLAHSQTTVATPNRVTSGVMARSTAAFRTLGLIGKNASVMRARVLPPVASTAAQRTAQSGRTAAADGSLLFEYRGYTDDQRKVLSQFVSKNYGFMVTRYGLPSPEQRANGGKTIEVVNSTDSFGYQPLLKAVDTPRGDGGSIFLPYDTTATAAINQFNFTRLILRAFQGPNTFSYDYNAGKYNDIYQAGMADAAALLVLYDSLSAADKAKFDPSDYEIYVLQFYDLLNRPELSTAYILPPLSNPDPTSILPEYRFSMAQAAWLKVAIENPNFFRDFNAKYYAQVSARQAATPAQLRGIAASVTPTVEGLGFQDWVRRQYILNNAITTGLKIYPIVAPRPIPATGDRRGGFFGAAEAFSTDENGLDTKVTGYGSIDAFDENGANINLQSKELTLSNLLNVGKGTDDGPDFAAGFTDFPAPNRARLTVRIRFKGAETTAVVPSVGAVAAGASQTTILGVATNGVSGDVALSGDVGSETLALSRGAFVGSKLYPSGPSVVSTLTLGGRTFKRNTAWITEGSRGVAFVLDGAATNSDFTLKTASGASTVRMISLPFFPAKSDEADILGIAAADLKLARYRPNLVPGTLNGGVLSFGIDADRHEIYPNISAPMAPGRGYWLGAGEITRTIQGAEPSRSQPYEVPLPGGWNQFGVPFNTSISPDAIRVRYGSFAPVSYADAVKNGLVAAGIWRWQPRGAYARVDGTGEKLPPFEGFYIYAIPSRGVSLVFAPGGAARTAARVASGWSVPLVASTSKSRDSSNSFGVAGATSGRVAAAKPPTGPLAVTLHFASSGSAAADGTGAGAASGWADSFLAGLERSGQWNLAVEGTKRGEAVALSWGELKGVPTEVKLSLRDQKTGKTLAMRAGGSYKWTGDGTPRGFSIAAVRVATATLQVSKAPSRGVQITLGLNLAVRGRLEIRNAAGDTIFTLKSGDFAAKTETFAWSGAQNDGKIAPRGTYRAIWIPELATDKGATREFKSGF